MISLKRLEDRVKESRMVGEKVEMLIRWLEDETENVKVFNMTAY